MPLSVSLLPALTVFSLLKLWPISAHSSYNLLCFLLWGLKTGFVPLVCKESEVDLLSPGNTLGIQTKGKQEVPTASVNQPP